ncbi:hypothetical protein HYW87_00635 [Candidatus Roizmanbacteria bacterium]|nr:hypothetical protein [Candidatus Roizmanbacteria bacterium]
MKRLINYYPFIFFSVILVFVTRKFLFKDGNIVYGEFFGSNNYFFFLKYFLSAWGDYTTFGHSNIALTTSYGKLGVLDTPSGEQYSLLTFSYFFAVNL